MNSPVVVNMAISAAMMAFLTWPAAISAQNLDRYGKQQLALKQNRYGNPTWSNGVSRSGWASSYGVGSGHMMRHYPVPMNRYRTMAGDYYDTDLSGAYDPRPYDQLDYAVVRYPSYGGSYYPVPADLSAAYDGGASNDGLMYSDMSYGGDRDPVAAALTSSSSYYPAMAAKTINRFEPPPQPAVNRYEPVRYPPTDKIHKFRKVFMSNLVSPSNVFKSTKEQQLYDFWESLINGGMDSDNDNDDDDADDDVSRMGDDFDGQRGAGGQGGRQQLVTAQLYQHLPPIFQQLQQQQQKFKHQLHQQQSADERTQSSPSSSASQTLPRGNQYKQWANGSPLIKRSSAASQQQTDVNDDVRQLERLRTNATADAATTVTIATTVPAPSMADGGQREYVLPRPAGEKSGFESLLEVIAEGGLRGHGDENGQVDTHAKFHQETKVNKKRSFVSDETSLAAQLGALRKN